MSVIGTRAADGTVQVPCPRPGCSAVLRVQPRADRTWVTCPADGCRHQFVLEVPGPVPPPLPPRPRRDREHEPGGGSGLVAALIALGAVVVLLLGAGLVGAVVWLTQGKDAPPPDPVAETPAPVPAAPAFDADALRAPADPARPEPAPPPAPPDVTAEVALRQPKKGPRPGPAPKADPAPADSALDKVKRSTALIERKDKGSGSGFVIKSGMVMTNFHVIAGCPLEDLRVTFVSLGDTAPAPLKPTLVYCHPERDLAILRVDTDRPPLEFCSPDTQLEGLEVAVVGNPADGVRGQVTVNKVTTGRLAAPIRRGAGWTYYELRAEARPGNSGGPVVDRKTGKLVGVMQSIALGKGPERSYCIPFGEARAALDRVPEDRDQEARAIKVAAARHALDCVNRELPALEGMARLGMDLQLHLLRAKAGGSGASVQLRDRRTGRLLSGTEVMTQLKEEFDKVYPQLAKYLDGPVRASPEVPSGLASKARLRLETCGAMRSLAGGKTDTETEFRKRIDSRTAANERAARAFEEDYKKFLDGLDAPAKGR